jgi:fumarate reductase flavoprotein subunit
MNESWGYGTAEAVFTAQPGATAFAIFDEATKAAMLTRADIEREMTILPGTDVLAAMFVSKAIDDLVTQGMITKAESLTQLARILDLPEADLLGTMARYNHLCERGFDEDFFKTARLRTVAGPPFYAFQLNMAGFALTTSGIRIDHNASVVHRNSNAIPGLFAAGECTGGIIVRAYVGSGNGLANASTFGRIAGRNAAAFARSGSIPPLDWSLYGMSSEDHH